MNEATLKKKHKGRIIFLSICGVLIVLLLTLYLTANYPAAVLLGSEYRHDMEVMHEELNKLACEHLHIDPYIEHGLSKPHCFVSAERTDPIAKDAFDRMISFLNEKKK